MAAGGDHPEEAIGIARTMVAKNHFPIENQLLNTVYFTKQHLFRPQRYQTHIPTNVSLCYLCMAIAGF